MAEKASDTFIFKLGGSRRSKPSLAEREPELAALWDVEGNHGVSPEEVPFESEFLFVWKGKDGKPKAATIAEMLADGCVRVDRAKCLATPARKSLAIMRPDLAAEWHAGRNKALMSDVAHISLNRKVWWRCDAGHAWQASIKSRLNGRGCPFCNRKQPERDAKGLAAARPDLAAEWCMEKNGGLTPCDAIPNDAKAVWWRCANGHEWNMTVRERAAGKGCPVCSGLRLIPGVNDLATVRPDLVAEWNPERNGDLAPTDLFSDSPRDVWWKCSHCGHEWCSKPAVRCRMAECPECGYPPRRRNGGDV